MKINLEGNSYARAGPCLSSLWSHAHTKKRIMQLQLAVSVEKLAIFERIFTFARAKLVGGCGFKREH